MAGSKKQLLLIDSHALVHRAYHAFPPLTTSKKELVNAVYGFTTMLLSSIKKYGPEYIACAFDEKGPTFREKKFVGYKSHRPKMDKELSDQLVRVHEVVEALNIPSFSVKGYEADDIIGTLVQKYIDGKYGDKNLEVIVISGDKDLLQLLGKDVHVSLPGRGFSDPKIWKIKDFKAKYGFAPDLLVDYKGMVGDSSDNIPGIKGVGDKTATELIKKFGSLEKIYEKIGKIPEKFRKRFEGQKEIAEMSKDLATIVRDVNIDFDLEKCKVSSYDREQTLALFKDLDFSSLVKLLPETDGEKEKKVSAKELKQTKMPTKAEVKVADGFACTIVNDEKSLKKMLKTLKGAKEIVVDAETNSVDQITAEMVGFSISDGKHSWYIQYKDKDGQIDFGKAFFKLLALLKDPELKKIGHNLKFDKHIFLNEEIEFNGVWFDTMIAAYLLNMGERNMGLKALAFDYLGIEMTPFEDLFTKDPDLFSEDVETLSKYCCMDSFVCWKLRAKLEPKLKKIENLKLFHDMEMPIVDILVKMERQGIEVNEKTLDELDAEFAKRIKKIEKKIYDAVGHEFNPGSPAQVGEVLFDELNLTFRRKTKTGFSTGDAILRKLEHAHPVVPLIREYREVSKLKSTYVKGLLKLVNKKTGRVHTSYNQAVTATGRLSSSKPNLQNIPIRSDLGNEIRRCFVAEKGFAFVSLDYSQIELRILAHESKDPELQRIFNKGFDIHKATASIIFDVPIENVTKKQRSVGKTMNFAVLYGMTEYGLSDMLEINRAKAKQYIERFFDRFPKVRDYFEDVLETTKKRGYAETMFGRRRYFAFKEGYQRIQGLIREANNMPMQGGNADIMKMAMIEVDEILGSFPFEARMLLQVHDELVFEVELAKHEKKLPLKKLYSDKNLKMFVPKVMKQMEKVIKLSVPLDVDAEVGYNWADGIEVEPDVTME